MFVRIFFVLVNSLVFVVGLGLLWIIIIDLYYNMGRVLRGCWECKIIVAILEGLRL